MPFEAYNGLRVGKTDSTGTYAYVCDGTSPGSPILTDGVALYTPGLSERRSGSSLFYNSDNLGNLWSVEDGTGQAEAGAYLFTGFGAPVYTGSGSGSASPLKYGGANGCQTDYDSGLVLMGHRYYDVRTGRFLSQDPAGAGTNWYSYAGNNPTNKTDPMGLAPMDGPGSSASGSPGYGGFGSGAGIVNQEDDYESYVYNQGVDLENAQRWKAFQEALKTLPNGVVFIAPRMDAPGQVVNESDKSITVVFDTYDNSKKQRYEWEMTLPPGYETNPFSIDADFTKISGAGWVHIGGYKTWGPYTVTSDGPFLYGDGFGLGFVYGAGTWPKGYGNDPKGYISAQAGASLGYLRPTPSGFISVFTQGPVGIL